jgi:astacin (peptidase family M12A)
MADIIKACIDKVVEEKGDPYEKPTTRMAVIRAKRWKPGMTLRVKFLGGNPAIQKKVEEKAKDWENYANIKFDFVPDGDAHIRIAFETDGSWSYIGTDALGIPQNEPTMNYGWLETDTPDEEYSRVVKHEFGHALSCIHEHQNPAANIPWDREAVYRYYMGPPNNWTRAQVDNNLFARYSRNITNFTNLDTTSIMLYPIPAQFTLNHQAIGARNNDLSAVDKQFIKEQYPQ